MDDVTPAAPSAVPPVPPSVPPSVPQPARSVVPQPVPPSVPQPPQPARSGPSVPPVPAAPVPVGSSGPLAVPPGGDGAGAPGGSADPEDAPLTRRKRREAARPAPEPVVLPASARRPHPAATATLVVLGAFLLFAARADAALAAAAYGSIGLVVAAGWAFLWGLPGGPGSSLAVGTTSLGCGVALWRASDAPYLRYVPVAVVLGLFVVFAHQLARRSGRERLVESIGASAVGIALVVLGTGYVALLRGRSGIELLTIAVVATVAGGLGDYALFVSPLRRWILPVTMLLGALAAEITSAFVAGPPAGRAALLGLCCASVGLAVRRVLSTLPDLATWRGHVTVAAGSLLSAGAVAAVLGRFFAA